MFLHVPAHLAEKVVVDGLVRGVAILELADDGHVAIDAQQREYELLEVRALVFAVAMGNVERRLFALSAEVIAVQTHRGRVEVGVVRGDGKAFQGTDRQRREDLLRACLKEAIEHSADVIVAEVLRGQFLAEQQRPVAVLECRLQMVQGTAPGQGIEYQAQDDQTRLHLHLRLHQAIDDFHQPQAPHKVRNDRQMVDLPCRDCLCRSRPMI